MSDILSWLYTQIAQDLVMFENFLFPSKSVMDVGIYYLDYKACNYFWEGGGGRNFILFIED